MPRPPRARWSASSVRRRRLIRAITGVYGLLLAVGSLVPGRNLPKMLDWGTLFSQDKIAHFGAYALFAVLLSLSLPGKSRWKNAATAVVISSAFGVLMEVLQGQAGTGREFDPVDMVANLLGALLGGALYLLAQPIFAKYLTPVRL